MSDGAGEAVAIEGGRPLRGNVVAPGDKSISHRALILGALAQGTSFVRGRSDGEDVRMTEEVVRALGAGVDSERVEGTGGALCAPSGPLEFGNSGTGMRLMAGVVAGYPWKSELTGDGSLSERPMDRVAEPLRLMGAEVSGRGERCLPPLEVTGASLRGIDYTTPMASAQVKSCILLAALRAEGRTVVREPVCTRAHTEELLRICGADIDVTDVDDGRVVSLSPGPLRSFDVHVPGDPSQAAFWVVAACIVPGSEVKVERVYTGRERRGFLEVLGRMGAAVEETQRDLPGEPWRVSDISARSSALVATEVDSREIPSLDEVPVLAIAAAVAKGTTTFHGVGELRVKESDRFSGVVELVRSFGATADASGDDLRVTGVPALSAADFDTRGDHRLAMAAAVAAASVAGRPSRLVGFSSVRTSYPGFSRELASLSSEGAGSTGR